MFINRDWNLDEKTDWQKNVQSRIGHLGESVPQYDKRGVVVGWKISSRYE